MAQTPDPSQERRDDRRSSEEDHRPISEHLESGPLGSAELRLMGLVEALRGENQRLAAEVESLGTKNIELVFQIEESEQNLQQAQVALDEARREAVRVATELKDLQARAEETLRAERQGLEQEMDQIRAEAEEGSRALDLLRQQAAQDQGRALELEGLLGEVRAQADASADREATLAEQVTRQTERLEALEGDLRLSRAHQEDREAESLRLRQELEAEQARREQVESESSGLKTELAEWSRRMEEIEAELADARLSAREQGAQLAEALQEKATLEAACQAAAARSEALEKTLRQVREQFLQRLEQPSRPDRSPEDLQASPDRAVANLMESLLGSTGPVLVQRVYARCEVDPATRDPHAHLRVLVSLEETALRLVATPEKRERLGLELERLRAALSALAEGAEPLPERSAEVPPVAEVVLEDVVPAQTELAGLEAAQPDAEVPLQEAAVAAPTRVSEALAEEVVSVAEERHEETPPRVTEVPSDSGPAPWRSLRAEEDAVLFRHASDPALRARIEEGMKMVALEKFDNAWDLFQELSQAHPDVLEIQEGLFYNYFGSFCFNEALDVGRRILAAEMESPGAGRFVKAMHTVLIERLKAVRDAAERKRLFLNLAEIHLDDAPQALDFLARARQIPGRGPIDARLNYYRLRLQAGDSAEQYRDVLGALEGLADHPELFDDLDRASGQERNRAIRPAAQVVLALVRQGREVATRAEKGGGERVAAVDLDPNLVEEQHDDQADQIVEFLLNRLLPRGEVAVSFPDPGFTSLLEDSQPAPVGWKPAELLERLAWRLFHHKNVRAHLCSGSEPFWIRAVPEPTPQVLFHPEVAALPTSEQQGLVLRVLFHLHHRHIHLQRAAELLDNPTRCRLLGLTRDVVQETGTDVSDSLEREIDSVDPERPDLDLWLDQMLGRLHDHCLREEFLILRDFFRPGQLFRARLEGSADRFVSRLVGLTAASYGIARTEFGRVPLFEEVEQQGFQVLYRSPLPTWRPQRARLQRLWVSALR